MTMEDSDFMLELKNYPETRQFAIQTQDEIKKEDHERWLKDNLIWFKVAEGYNGPVGAVRIFGGEISIWVHRNFRGLGVATQIIKEVSTPGMIARIVDGNTSSMRAFVKAGYLTNNHIENYYTLRYQ